MNNFMKYLTIVVLLVIAGCGAPQEKKVDYTKMIQIAQNLEKAFDEMEVASNIPLDTNEYDQKKEDVLYQLTMNQLELDSLPAFEKDPEKHNAKEFNELHYAPRQIANQLQDIQYLLYDAMVANDQRYLDTVVTDNVIAIRLEYIIKRCQNKGLIQPLPDEYAKLPLRETGGSIEIEIEETVY